MNLSVARCHFPVRGLGYGVRTGIWLQGCSIRCSGCIVPETWVARSEHLVPLIGLVAATQPWIEASDGVTVSGGEPFDQPEGLFALLTAVRELGAGDVLVYSGYRWLELERAHGDILELCDVVVSEPYEAAACAATSLTGSANQRVHLLTKVARERYADWRGFPAAASVTVDGDAVRLSGVMTRGTVSRLAEHIGQASGRRTRLTHGPL